MTETQFDPMSVPMVVTGAEASVLAKACIAEWKRLAGPDGVARFLEKIKFTKQNLSQRSGLSNETGELQYAGILPQFVENAMAYCTRSADWPRTHPALWAAVWDEFSVGIIGEYGASVKSAGTNARRDFGLAIGEGDR